MPGSSSESAILQTGLYSKLLEELSAGASVPKDCGSIWLLLHRHHKPVTLVRDVLQEKTHLLFNAKKLEEADTCSRLLIDATLQAAGGAGPELEARHLRYRVQSALNNHGAAAEELEAALALVPNSRPYLWVELARMRHAQRASTPGGDRSSSPRVS